MSSFFQREMSACARKCHQCNNISLCSTGWEQSRERSWCLMRGECGEGLGTHRAACPPGRRSCQVGDQSYPCPTRSLVHKLWRKLPHFPTGSKSICSIFFLSESLLPSPVNFKLWFWLCPGSSLVLPTLPPHGLHTQPFSPGFEEPHSGPDSCPLLPLRHPSLGMLDL